MRRMKALCEKAAADETLQRKPADYKKRKAANGATADKKLPVFTRETQSGGFRKLKQAASFKIKLESVAGEGKGLMPSLSILPL